jgi:hypothetical protein
MKTMKLPSYGTRLSPALLAFAYAMLLATIYILSIQIVWAGLAFFLLMPFLQIVLYQRRGGSDLFGLCKRLGVIPTVMVYLVVRHFVTPANQTWITGIAWVVLIINIGMVVVVDARKRRWSNMLAGLALIVGVGWPSSVGFDLALQRLTTDAGLAWIIAYTGWNAAFILRRHPERVFYYAAVLGVPLGYGLLVSKALWLESRVMILATHLLLMDLWHGRLPMPQPFLPAAVPRLCEAVAWLALAWQVWEKLAA